MAYPYYPYQQQVQQSFVSVRSTADVEAWPIAPGNSITYYIEGNPPMIATKTKGFSPLENPVVTYYDLTERPRSVPAAAEGSNGGWALKTDLEAVRADLEALRKKLEAENE